MGLTTLWIVTAIILIVLDIITSALLFVWIALGAFCALIGNYAGLSFWWQIVIFSVVSIISVAIGYPWAKNTFKNKIPKTKLMEETYIGMEFVAEKDIEQDVRFKVNGIYWTGHNKGNKISKGDKFKIKEIEGNGFVIEKSNQD